MTINRSVRGPFFFLAIVLGLGHSGPAQAAKAIEARIEQNGKVILQGVYSGCCAPANTLAKTACSVPSTASVEINEKRCRRIPPSSKHANSVARQCNESDAEGFRWA
jgi:hypothetical protein